MRRSSESRNRRRVAIVAAAPVEVIVISMTICNIDRLPLLADSSNDSSKVND